MLQETDPRRERALRYIHEVWPRIANLGDPFREAKTVGYALAHDVIELLNLVENQQREIGQLQTLYMRTLRDAEEASSHPEDALAPSG